MVNRLAHAGSDCVVGAHASDIPTARESAHPAVVRRHDGRAPEQRRPSFLDEREPGNLGILFGRGLKGGRMTLPRSSVDAAGSRAPPARTGETRSTSRCAGRPSVRCVPSQAQRPPACHPAACRCPAAGRQPRSVGPGSDRAAGRRWAGRSFDHRGARGPPSKTSESLTAPAHVKGKKPCPGPTRKPPSRPSRARRS